MKVTPFFRSLTVILAIGALLSGGCLGRSPAPRFYALHPLPEDQAASTRTGPARHVVVGIGPLKVADYLDESQIVTRTGDHQLAKAEFHRWAGSLSDNLANVLTDNLGLLLPTDRIYRFPWRTSVPIDYQVVMDVVRFDGRLGEAAWLEARWSVLQGPERKLLKTRRAHIREPVTGPDYVSLVAAQSRALATLSQEIAQAIQGAADATGVGRPASKQQAEQETR
jgi:uncharacterized lipoprotein YmbA